MKLSSWMSEIPDDRRLSDIAIPGTHDSATYKAGNLSWKTAASLIFGFVGFGIERRAVKFAQSQSRSVSEQLMLGIRFFDLRLVQRKDGGFSLYHGIMDLGVDLDEALRQIRAFLDCNPSETVLVCFKKEDNDDDRRTFAQAVMKHLGDTKHNFYTQSRIPKMSEIRGKMVVINRMFEVADSGIFVFITGTNDNHEQKQADGSILTFAIQDDYSGLSKGEKIAKIAKAYKEGAGKQRDLRICFASATNAPTISPGEFADEINPKIRNLLRDNAGSTPWITLIDYAGDYGSGLHEPIAAIISTNRFNKGPGHHRDTLRAGETLKPGEQLLSDNGAFSAVFQTDGNFVVYRRCDDYVVAATGTHGKGADQAILQNDGNFVIYAGNRPKSDTETSGQGGKRLVMQNDGNLVLYKQDDTAVWASETCSFHDR